MNSTTDKLIEGMWYIIKAFKAYRRDGSRNLSE
jgi:hypothetical protein